MRFMKFQRNFGCQNFASSEVEALHMIRKKKGRKEGKKKKRKEGREEGRKGGREEGRKGGRE